MMRKRIALADRNGNQIVDAQGRPKTWNLKTHRLDESRITSFVVPPGLADTQVSMQVAGQESSCWGFCGQLVIPCAGGGPTTDSAQAHSAPFSAP